MLSREEKIKIAADYAEREPEMARKGFVVGDDGNIIPIAVQAGTTATLIEQRAREAAFIKLAATRANVAHTPFPCAHRGSATIFNPDNYIFDEDWGVWVNKEGWDQHMAVKNAR